MARTIQRLEQIHRLPPAVVSSTGMPGLRTLPLPEQRKYRLLYAASRKGKPGPKGSSPEIIQAIVELKQRNPRLGCPRIARQINKAFGTDSDKDVVRRVLATHYRLLPGGDGPSWLTFLGHTKDSLWSIDLFRCESILLKSHWVLVVMDQFTRRIIGVGVHDGDSPSEIPAEVTIHRADPSNFHWKSHCRTLYHLPIAA